MRVLELIKALEAFDPEHLVVFDDSESGLLRVDSPTAGVYKYYKGDGTPAYAEEPCVVLGGKDHP